MHRRDFLSSVLPVIATPSILKGKESQTSEIKLQIGEVYQTHIDYVATDGGMLFGDTVKKVNSLSNSTQEYYAKLNYCVLHSRKKVIQIDDFDTILNTKTENIILSKLIPSAVELQQLKDKAREDHLNIVLTDFGSISTSIEYGADLRYPNHLPPHFEPFGIENKWKNKIELYRIRLLREHWFGSTIYFCFNGNKDKPEIRVHDSLCSSRETDISTVLHCCFEQMVPGVLYLNRIRINYKLGWEYPQIQPSMETILLSDLIVKNQITKLLNQIKVSPPIETRDTENILRQLPIDLGRGKVIIGRPFIDDSVAWVVFETTSGSKYPIYSPEICWVWSDEPNLIPDPIRCAGGWFDRLGFLEWTITPSISITDVHSIEISQPRERRS